MITDSDDGLQTHRWYVAFRNPETHGQVYVRVTRTFRTESEAKQFAAERMDEGCDVSAGTLNPHLPRQMLGPSQIVKWLEGD